MRVELPHLEGSVPDGRKVKAIRTDSGGEYMSTKFEDYLKSEGIRHERTVPKTPEQNGGDFLLYHVISLHVR